MIFMTCAECRYYEKQSDKQGICRRRPPSVFPMPVHSKVIGSVGGNQVMLQSFYAPVDGGGWCGEWGLKGELN